ncbi:radical SAM protein [Pantoea sp. ICBG 828]|uniref:radical SAM protein n=1 Tax=unclassified Pantoea TaxID=2630326 RepID=UPI00073F43F9|nr:MULTISPECIES: radical SAM protein [unclassified Pantoea]NIG36636.1 radical SAM protein [Pantoea sp. Ap-959]PPC65116.1 radical SAM protein [Pantoea sp. ICBG 828]PPC68745.1 radical SAM protein [Pantoea sp. ICBG 985]
MRAAWLQSLQDIDRHYPRPAICEVLSRPENADLLEYVVHDPFGCHVFPGDIDDFPLPNFFRAMQHSLSHAPQIHLWAYIPTCRYKCHFCQFPTVIVNPQSPRAPELFRDIVDRNIQEAKLWLAQLPALGEVPVGEFNLFGGTPSLLPPDELRRLMDFYRNHFNFREATLRFEGEPGTLTREFLAQLRELGFSKLSFGAQSFSDRLIKGCGRLHSADACYKVIRDARELGFALVSVDLMYGLLGQTVDDVRDDLQQARALDLSHLVFTKLHMKPFAESRTGVSAEGENAWQRKNAAMPSLGQQYQMRALAEQWLDGDYLEHPTMYFHHRSAPPEKWKAIITDLDQQAPEVAIGLGGSSKCAGAELINLTDYADYQRALDNGELPIASVRGMSPDQQAINGCKMALSTLIPIDDVLFQQKFGVSLFAQPTIARALRELQQRELVHSDGRYVTLTPAGRVLVEAIINTQFD